MELPDMALFAIAAFFFMGFFMLSDAMALAWAMPSPAPMVPPTAGPVMASCAIGLAAMPPPILAAGFIASVLAMGFLAAMPFDIMPLDMPPSPTAGLACCASAGTARPSTRAAVRRVFMENLLVGCGWKFARQEFWVT